MPKYKRIHIYYTVHNSQNKQVQGSYLVDHSSHSTLSIVPPVLARAEVGSRSRDWVTCQRHLPSHEEAYVRRYLWSSVTLGGTGAHWSMGGAQLETRGWTYETVCCSFSPRQNQSQSFDPLPSTVLKVRAVSEQSPASSHPAHEVELNILSSAYL